VVGWACKVGLQTTATTQAFEGTKIMTKYIVSCISIDESKIFYDFWQAVEYANKLIRAGLQPHMKRIEE